MIQSSCPPITWITGGFLLNSKYCMVHVQCKSAILENSDNLPVWMDYDVLSITNYFQLVDILFTKTAETWARQDRLQPYTYMYNRWYRWYTTYLHVISSQTGTSDDQSESKVLLQLSLCVKVHHLERQHP